MSPVWDELLLFEEILVYGRREDIKANPPTVIIEIYDQDKVYKKITMYLYLNFYFYSFVSLKYFNNNNPFNEQVGKPEFIGRAIGKPHIQLCEDPYSVPKLEWFQIYRGTEEAGELLSAFEMFEVTEFES